MGPPVDTRAEIEGVEAYLVLRLASETSRAGVAIEAKEATGHCARETRDVRAVLGSSGYR